MTHKQFREDLEAKPIPNDLKEILLQLTDKYAKIKDREAFLKDLHQEEKVKGPFEL